ncbi:MAG TPA: CDP-diacylglycerol--serine O-phosphatidyltransferase [Rhodanobacteraceae bacterium]|nr:CDP-diacylglycerol--serine O-phosphatidyltransferase [Rhodanobacteraceae bacterium]
MTDPTPASPQPARPRRGIYLLPNLCTTGAMFAGFYAIIAAIAGNFTDAAIAVFVAGLLDGMDGRIARLTKTQSEFGMQYDSLSDMVSFGLAPAVVLYTWSLQYLRDYGVAWGKLGWAAAFLYAACAALRLARFNTQVGVADKRFFQGLASPAAAGLCMSFVWTMQDRQIEGAWLCFFTPILAIVAGLLMVSRVRYFSFKAWPRGDRVPFGWIVLAVLIVVALVLDPATVLLIIAVLYVFSGPVMTLWGLRSRSSRRRVRAQNRQAPPQG